MIALTRKAPQAAGTLEERENYDQIRLRQTRATADKLSAANRPHVHAWIDQALALGRKPGHTLAMCSALLQLDRSLKGRSILEADAADLRAFVQQVATPPKRGTGIQSTLARVRSFYNWAFPRTPGGEIHPTAALASRLLRHNGGTRAPEKKTLQPQETERLIQSGLTVRDRAVLALLADSGLRAREACAHNVGSFRPNADGTALLILPEDAAGLKTGPRSVAIMKAVEPIRALLAGHPTPYDARAPLLLTNSQSPRRISYITLSRALARAARRAGLPWVTCHPFRHTRATQAAWANWSEAKMLKQFGWRPGSKMPHFYTHITPDDLTRQLLADAPHSASHGVSEPAVRAPTAVQPAAGSPDLAALLAEALRRGLQAPR